MNAIMLTNLFQLFIRHVPRRSSGGSGAELVMEAVGIRKHTSLQFVDRHKQIPHSIGVQKTRNEKGQHCEASTALVVALRLFLAGVMGAGCLGDG
jgi:hypothetical protein